MEKEGNRGAKGNGPAGGKKNGGPHPQAEGGA